jgi:hypothetical protein
VLKEHLYSKEYLTIPLAPPLDAATMEPWSMETSTSTRKLEHRQGGIDAGDVLIHEKEIRLHGKADATRKRYDYMVSITTKQL